MASGSASIMKVEDIFQCADGHLACSRCSARLNKCPICRIPVDPDLEKRIRALSAEQAIKALNLNFSCRDKDCADAKEKEALKRCKTLKRKQVEYRTSTPPLPLTSNFGRAMIGGLLAPLTFKMWKIQK